MTTTLWFKMYFRFEFSQCQWKSSDNHTAATALPTSVLMGQFMRQDKLSHNLHSFFHLSKKTRHVKLSSINYTMCNCQFIEQKMLVLSLVRKPNSYDKDPLSFMSSQCGCPPLLVPSPNPSCQPGQLAAAEMLCKQYPRLTAVCFLTTIRFPMSPGELEIRKCIILGKKLTT